MKKAFPPLVHSKCTILILGTMPGEKSLELGEYYGNRGNQFWKLMYNVLNEDFSLDYENRKSLLGKYNIALWDVLEFCERQGSLDSNIKNGIPNNFDDFYNNHPDIKHVLFSSKNAAVYYDKYVGRKDNLNYDVLPSPSGANATKSFVEKLEIWTKKILPLT